MTQIQTAEILDVLRTLPLDKVNEVRDFALFLRDRYQPEVDVDYSDEWSDEDLRDATAASITYGYIEAGDSK